MMLSSSDFTKLKECNPCFLGVYPQNKLPITHHCVRPWCLIINSDTHTLPGKHWIAVYAPPHVNSVLFVDPLNLPVNRYSYIKNWLGQCFSHIIVLPYSIQPTYSIWCGAYCMYILKQLPLHNYDLYHVVKKYFLSNDLNLNDVMISNWYNKFIQ